MKLQMLLQWWPARLAIDDLKTSGFLFWIIKYQICKNETYTADEWSRILGEKIDDILAVLMDVGHIKKRGEKVSSVWAEKMNDQFRQQSAYGSMGGSPVLGKLYNEPGFVYFAERDDGLIKIGASKKPQKRRWQLKQSHGSDIRILKKIKVANMGEFERYYHEKFSEYQTEGEWFKLPTEVIRSIIHDS
jgi:hypothetical protein